MSSDSIDDEEREFLVQFSTLSLRTKKLIDQILLSRVAAVGVNLHRDSRYSFCCIILV